LKANAEILIEFSQIVFHEDKQQVYSLNSNSNHNWINNADAPSLDRPYIPPKDFSRQCLHSVTIQFRRYQPGRYPQVCLIDSNSKLIWENKTEGASLDRPYFPPTDFSRPRLTFSSNSVQSVSAKSSMEYVH